MHFYSSLHCGAVNQEHFSAEKPREFLFYSRNAQTTTFRDVFHENVAHYNKHYKYKYKYKIPKY